jgi:hypothetical protein
VNAALREHLHDRRRRIIRVDGSIELLEHPIHILEAGRLIGANTLDIVQLRHLGRPLVVMVVDDLGHEKRRPVNQHASELYWANCHPGTTHTIRGDVAIVLDDDYGEQL